MKKFLKYKYIIAVILLSFISVFSLLKPGLPPTHDGEYHIIRFYEFDKTMRSGILYPRWAEGLNNGYGIPLFNFVYPLPNYVASVFHFLGFSFIDSFKLNMILATTVGAVFFYLWTRKYWGDLGGLVSSVFYTFSPYHLLDIYVRGSVGEVWSLALAPGLFWAFLEYCQTNKKVYFVLSCLFLALLIYSHNILALVFFAFFLIYAAFLIYESSNKKKLFIDSLLICIFGLGLSSLFWLPALLETKYVAGLQIFDPTKHFPAIYKLIYSSWGYGVSGINISDQMSFQIGIANLLILFFVFSLLFIKKTKNRNILIYFAGILFLTIFLITPFSTFLWKSVPLISYVQFPWRFLSLVILIISFLSGFLVCQEIGDKNKRIIISFFLIILSIGLSIRYIKAPFHHLRNDNYYLTRSNFTRGTNSPGDSFNTVWLKTIPKSQAFTVRIADGSGTTKLVSSNITGYRVEANLKKASKIIFHSAYFPNWTAMIDDKKITTLNLNGLLALDVPKGKHLMRIWYERTNVENLASLYFLFSVLAIIYLYARRN